MSTAPIPVTVITGLLGAGKTTVLRHLLAQRPAQARWAVIVNDFGAVGIDAALLDAGGDGLAVREIAGGCVCCAAALSLRTALPRLLREWRPQRLLIEPSGLGHPAGVIDLLREPLLAPHLALRATLAVLDPRRLDDPRLPASSLFREQLEVADVLVGSHADRVTAAERAAFHALAAALDPPKLAVLETAHGVLDGAWLDCDPAPRAAAAAAVVAAAATVAVGGVPSLLPGALCRESRDGGHVARGWLFPPAQVFDARRLRALFGRVGQPGPLAPLLRAKGVFNVGWGWLAFNGGPAGHHVDSTAWRRDSRVEFIAAAAAATDWGAIEDALGACLAPAGGTPPQ